MTTLADGAICANSKVSSPSPLVTKKQQHPIDSTYHYRHRSGQNSRSRRRKLRQQNSVLCNETKLQTLSVTSTETNFKNETDNPSLVPKSQVIVPHVDIEEETQLLPTNPTLNLVPTYDSQEFSTNAAQTSVLTCDLDLALSDKTSRIGHFSGQSQTFCFSKSISPSPLPSTPVPWFQPPPGTPIPPTVVSQEEFEKMLRDEGFPPISPNLLP